MLDQIHDHSLCQNNEKQKCSWPTFHEDKTNILSGQFHGNNNIVSERAENTKITRYFAKNQRKVENVDVSVHKHFRQLLKDLMEELKLAIKIKNRRVQLVWMLESMEFAKTGQKLETSTSNEYTSTFQSSPEQAAERDFQPIFLKSFVSPDYFLLTHLLSFNIS